jgi:hypothetical protein
MEKSSRPTLSARQLAASVLLALIGGVALTILVVLPAESGKDPSGFGALTGLDQLSNTPANDSEAPDSFESTGENEFYVAIDPANISPYVDDFGDSQPALDGANIRTHDTPFKSETIEIPIDADGRIEYKALMDQGEVLLYEWTADGEVYYDFHAHEANGNPDFWTRYSEGEGTGDHGSIVAPYQGQHGWFWLNIEERPITVRLTIAGYYDELIEIDMQAEAGSN